MNGFRALLGLACGLLGALVPGLVASQPPPVDPSLNIYARPARLVALPGGRALNLDCRGAGSPTILFLPGLSSWSRTWSKVHAPLAERTRVCAFDPAGFGFSGASIEPQDATHITADLEQALTAAGIEGPYLVVGHSAGSLLALAFADRRPKAVVGMVLIDPSYPDQVARMSTAAPHLVAFLRSQDASEVAALERCAARLEAGPMPPDDPDADRCFSFRRYFPEAMKAALAKAQGQPAIMRTKRSHLVQVEASARQAVKPTRDYGDIPLIVLTRGLLGPPPGPPAPGLPLEAEVEGPAMDRLWVQAHEELARLSKRGERRTVAGAGHSIQFDKPDAVIGAVEDVLAKARD